MVLGADNPEKRTYFDIPEGKAVHTLREAARQAGVDILFVAKIVRGVRTSAVHGNYTMQEAIERMLSETQLIVVRDSDTGAIAVTEAPEPSPVNLTSDEPQDMEPQSMKKSPFKKVLSGILLFAIAYDGYSQNADDDVIELEEFEVTGFREGLAKAMQEQRESVNFKEVLSSDSVGNLPDANVAEALQRLPGLYLQTDDGGGDGRWVSIRGVDPILNNVTMNGQQIAVSDVQGRSGRAAPLDILSASALASVEVVKVATPDMDAQGLGGTIDIKTPSGFDHEGTYAFGGFKYGFNEFCGDCDINEADVNFTTRLGAEKKVAVYMGANYSFRDYISHLAENQGFENLNDVESINGIVNEFGDEPMGQDLRLGSAMGSRERKGVSGNIEWQVNEGTKLWVRGYFTDWDEEELRPQMSLRTFNLDSRWTTLTEPRVGFVTRGRIESETEFELTERQVRQIVVGGEHRFGDSWVVDGNLNFTLASEDRPDGVLAQEEFSCDGRSGGATAHDPDFACFEFDRSGFWPVITLGPQGDALWPGEGDIGDLSFHPFFRLRRETSEVEEDRFEFDLNVKRGGKIFGHDGFIKSGVKYSTKDRFVSDRSMRYRRDRNPDDPAFFQSDFIGDLPYGILHANIGDLGSHSLGPQTGPNAGIYARQLGPVNNIAALRADFAANIGAAFDDAYDEITDTPDPCATIINPFCPEEGLFGPWEFDEEASRENGVEDDYFLTEDILAWYAMAELHLGEKLTLMGGVRVEWTDADVGAFNSGNSYENPDEGFTITRLEFDPSYTNVLPNFQVRWEPNDSLVFRGAVSTSLGRPDYPDLAPIGKVDFDPVFDGDEFTGFAENGELEEGNPGLQPYEALNVDLTASYYFANGAGMLQFGFFYKDVENAIYQFNFDAVEDNVNLLGKEMTRGTATHPITGETVDIVNFRGISFTEMDITTFNNAEPGEITGFEVTYQQNFTFLPAPLDGFGVVANFTFIDSEVTIPERPGEKLPFFLQADDLYNVQVFYQKRGLEARLAYHFQGDAYKSVGGDEFSDLFWKERAYWDAKVSYQINRNFNIFGEVKNITNEPVETYFFQPQFLGNDNGLETYGTVFFVGMTWNFGE